MNTLVSLAKAVERTTSRAARNPIKTKKPAHNLTPCRMMAELYAQKQKGGQAFSGTSAAGDPRITWQHGEEGRAPALLPESSGRSAPGSAGSTTRPAQSCTGSPD